MLPAANAISVLTGEVEAIAALLDWEQQSMDRITSRTACCTLKLPNSCTQLLGRPGKSKWD